MAGENQAIMPPLGWCKPGLEATEHPSIQDIYWTAGFCEGEASFCRDIRRKYYQRVQLPQVEDNLWALQKMQRLFGGSISSVWKNAYSKRGMREQYRWIISGSRARGFMMTIFSLMSPKRKSQIQRALQL